MSDYVKSTDFASKDTLPSGDSAKIVRGTEIDAEFEALEVAIASKANTSDVSSTYAPLNSPTFTGSPTAPTPTSGDNDTSIATTAFVSAITGTNGINGFKNRIINGAMLVNQRGSVDTPITANDATYGADRFKMSMVASSKGTIQQSSTAPAGFKNSLLFTSSAATVVGSTDYYSIVQPVEGLNVADFGWGAVGAATITISFWVRSSLTGTFGGSVQNSGTTRSYPFSYAISSANTWEQKTITVAGDTTGTWLTTNGIGLQLRFSLGMGSTYSGTANAWVAGDYESVTGATSVVGTSGATFYITGVQLEKGSTATSFDYRPYGTELALCQRYLPAFNATTTNETFGVGYCTATTNARVLYSFQVTPRVKPTGITVTSGTPLQITGSGSASGAPTFNMAGTASAMIDVPITGGTLNAGVFAYTNASNVQILFNGCEL